MVVRVYDLMRGIVCLGDMALDHPVLELIAIKLVHKAKPANLFVAQLSLKAIVIDCFFAQPRWSPCSEATDRKI
jgi:hypothetical protein